MTRQTRKDRRSKWLARSARRAFTLIELMIVVAIVGILAVIGVVGYRKIILSSKMTEATGVISGIRVAQEAYKTERGVYADIGTTFCPRDSTTGAPTKTGWLPTCSGGSGTWTQLPVHIDGPVQFGYTTVASGTPDGHGFVTMTGLDVSVPWFVTYAAADLDGAGAPFTQLVQTSQGNQIFTNGDGL